MVCWLFLGILLRIFSEWRKFRDFKSIWALIDLGWEQFRWKKFQQIEEDISWNFLLIKCSHNFTISKDSTRTYSSNYSQKNRIMDWENIIIPFKLQVSIFSRIYVKRRTDHKIWIFAYPFLVWYHDEQSCFDTKKQLLDGKLFYLWRARLACLLAFPICGIALKQTCWIC